jgi:hypothetical protein
MDYKMGRKKGLIYKLDDYNICLINIVSFDLKSVSNQQAIVQS